MRPRRPGQASHQGTNDSSTRVYSAGPRATGRPSPKGQGEVASTSGLRRPARRRELRASRKHAGMMSPIRLSTAVRRRVRAAGPDRNFCPAKTQLPRPTRRRRPFPLVGAHACMAHGDVSAVLPCADMGVLLGWGGISISPHKTFGELV
jgi:hypothetical protein